MYYYLPAIGDTVTTVSLQFGRIIKEDEGVLTVQRRDGSEYFASVQAVIRVTRGDQTYVIERRRRTSLLHPHETSWAQREFMTYMANRSRNV